MSETKVRKNDLPNRCGYCANIIENDDFLQCIKCLAYVHIKCLKHSSTPGDILGDVFFDLTCSKCMQLNYDGPSPSNLSGIAAREKFVRKRLPWVMIITLAIYNLSIKSKGIGRQGYFHWRSHIASFIAKNWNYLFESTTRRRKNWTGSISSALSSYNTSFFISGQKEFNELGWWKLAYPNQTPKFIYKLFEQFSQKRQQTRSDKRSLENSSFRNENVSCVSEIQDFKQRQRSDSDEDLSATDSCSRTIPYMGRKPKITKHSDKEDDLNKNAQQQQSLSSVQSSLMDFLAENLTNDDLTIFNNFPNIVSDNLEDENRNNYLPPLTDSYNDSENFFNLPEVKSESFELKEYQNLNSKLKSIYAEQDESSINSLENSNSQDKSLMNSPRLSDNSNDSEEQDQEFKPRIVQVTNFQQLPTPMKSRKNGKSVNNKYLQQIKKEIPSDDESMPKSSTDKSSQNSENENSENAEESSFVECKPSLFNKTVRRNWPWLVEKVSTGNKSAEKLLQSKQSVVMMSEYEEKEILHKLQKIFALQEECRIEIPSYVRRYYRKLCVRNWKHKYSRPVFNLDQQLNANRKTLHNEDGENKIIDRYQLISRTPQDTRKSFMARIAGCFNYEIFESPYTKRTLHPFIYRNKECSPLWLRLMCEIQYKVNGIAPVRAPIDFCYVRPNHIAAVNALLQSVFWPGIDMSECLSYPDFSVVALYKQLVIGCGFLVPDVNFNEAYISFMAVRPNWQRSGIGTFMLYHLIQTCMSKDITLHVSANNAAVVLYQKFGFKIEEVMLNFYDKYFPFDSNQSRNAFFLRLMR